MNGALNDLASAVFMKLARIATWRETRRRRAVLSQPFPAESAALLERRSAHYRRLPAEYASRFREQVQIFTAEKRVTGVQIELTDEARLLVAASAVSLSVGWPGYTWDQLAEVLIYPQDFDRDYTFEAAEMSGLAHHWGTVILSKPVLDRSFDETLTPHHVGFHEFAHLLDLSHARFDGVPSHLSEEGIRQWTRILEREEDRLHRRDSILDPYALSGPVELFAVAVEAFFQTPGTLLMHHAELYRFLSTYFCQDPAAWAGHTHNP